MTDLDSREAASSMEDRAPFGRVTSQSTYAEWLKRDSRKFPARYYRAQGAEAAPKYTLDSKLRQGRFGPVLLVTSLMKGCPLRAMKVMSKERIKERGMATYALGELRALSAVRHPLIISLMDQLRDKSNVYFVMPFIECGDLHRLMLSSRLKRFSYAEAKFYAAQVFLALEYLHAMRVVYRNLRPEHLLLDRGGFVRLADLGFAKLLDGNTERAFSTLGPNLEYMAPEFFQPMFCGYSYSVDWWTLGCLMYELMVGIPPYHEPCRIAMGDFEGDPIGGDLGIVSMIVSAEIQFPSFIRPDAKDLVARLCQKRRCRRLGCQKAGPTAIREHPFFRDTDFVRVFHRQVPAPHKPTCRDDFYTGRPLSQGDMLRDAIVFEEF